MVATKCRLFAANGDEVDKRKDRVRAREREAAGQKTSSTRGRLTGV